jgi:hypothetical protein
VVDAKVLVSELLRVRGRGLIGGSALELRVSEETLDEALHEMTLPYATRIVTVPREVYADFACPS